MVSFLSPQPARGTQTFRRPRSIQTIRRSPRPRDLPEFTCITIGPRSQAATTGSPTSWSTRAPRRWSPSTCLITQARATSRRRPIPSPHPSKAHPPIAAGGRIPTSAIRTCWCSTATAACSTRPSTRIAAVEHGTRRRKPSGICRTTSSGRGDGPRPTPPACPSFPDSCATTK